MAHTPEEIQKHVKVYLFVFAALAIMTVVTVAVSYIDLPIYQAIAVTLFVASIKGGLVGAYFMHLISERKLIHYILILTFIFFAVLMSLPVLTDFDMIRIKH